MRLAIPPLGAKVLSPAERARLPGSFVRLDRGWVHYELSGPRAGPLVVLIPGLSVPYATWDRTAPALAEAGYRVLRYDHFGRGYSDRPRGPYSLESHVDQLEDLLKALGLDGDSVLVGLSMGGPVAAAAALRLQERVKAVVFVDPLYEWPRGKAGGLVETPLLGDLLMALRGKAILACGQAQDFSDPAEYRAFLPHYLQALAYRGMPRAALATIRSIPSWPLTDIYEDLGRKAELPILLIWGRLDKTLPIEQGRRLLARLPKAAFVVVEDAGHVPHWERPDRINAEILFFLAAKGIGGRP